VRPPLTKDSSILELLTNLERMLGPDAFHVADHWGDDLYAIGIASRADSRALVYISTLNHPPGRFSYECEAGKATSGPDDLPYDVADAHEDVSFEELVSAVRRHFCLAR
jgi:hypothetical protein